LGPRGLQEDQIHGRFGTSWVSESVLGAIEWVRKWIAVTVTEPLVAPPRSSDGLSPQRIEEWL